MPQAAELRKWPNLTPKYSRRQAAVDSDSAVQRCEHVSLDLFMLSRFFCIAERRACRTLIATKKIWRENGIRKVAVYVG